MISPRLALLVVLLLPASGAAVAAERPDPSTESIDVILALDSSLSLRRTDARGFGQEMARDIVDFLQPGDRIGVVRFAGWEETVRRGTNVFDLEAVPEDEAERKAFRDRYLSSLDTGLGEFGRGTDFNVAFQEGVFRLFGGPEGLGQDRPAWVILYTDGGMDVIEGDRVRERYLTDAGGGETPEREALNRAALAVLRTEVVPHLERDSVTVTVLYPGKLRPEQRAAPLPSRFPDAGTGGRETLNWVLEEMGRSASLEPEAGGATEVSSAAPLLYPFRLPQGVVSARLFVFGEVVDYTVEIAGPRGTSLLDVGAAGITRQGRLYRVVEVTAPEAGDHLLTVETPSEASARFLVKLDVTQDLRLFVRLAEDREAYHAGEPVPVEAGLVIASTGASVTDPALLKEFQGSVRVEDPNGNIEQSVIPPSRRGPSKFNLRPPLSAVPGSYRVRVAGQLPGVGTGDAPRTLGPVETEFSMRGLISVEFAADGTFVGKPMRIVGLSAAGTAKLEGATVIVSNDGATTLRDVRLSPSEGHLEGTVTLDEPGRWYLEGASDDKVDILLGVRTTIDVADRKMEIFPLAAGTAVFPAEAVDSVTVVETGSGYAGRVGVRYDMIPGEEGTLSAAFMGPSGEEMGEVLLDGKKEVTLSGDKTDRIVEIRPRGTTIDGRVEFRATLAGYEALDEVRLLWGAAPAIEPVPRNRMILMAVGAVLALIVFLGGVRWVRSPRFKDERLWCLGQDQTTEHWLRDMKKGLMGSRAIGTPEVPSSIEFLLKSRKQAREGKCLLRPLQQIDTIYVNAFALAGPLEIKDGAEIVVERDGFPIRYMYYATEPPQEADSGEETQTLEAQDRPLGAKEEPSVGPEDLTQLE